MPHPQVTMLLSNPYRPDIRVQREAHSLQTLGYAVKIIGWDRQAELPALEEDRGVTIQRIQHIRSQYYAGMRQGLIIPRFWDAAVRLSEQNAPDIVHCHDLDTLYAGVRIKHRLGSRLVYDAHEHYPAMMSLYLPALFVRWLERLEKQLMRQADVVFTASSVLAERYRNQGYEPVIVLPNAPELDLYDTLDKLKITQKRQELGGKQGELLIGYVGGLTRNRVLLPLIDAVNGLEGVRLYIWGDGIQRSEVEKAVRQTPQASYLGWLPYNQVPLCVSALDVLFYAIQPDYPGAVFNAPNALAHAMSAGKPVIANQVGDLGNIIQQEHCGLLLEKVTLPSIRDAIRALQNDYQQRQGLGLAGRAAAVRKYHWAHSATSLAEAYAALLPSQGQPSVW